MVSSIFDDLPQITEENRSTLRRSHWNRSDAVSTLTRVNRSGDPIREVSKPKAAIRRIRRRIRREHEESWGSKKPTISQKQSLQNDLDEAYDTFLMRQRESEAAQSRAARRLEVVQSIEQKNSDELTRHERKIRDKRHTNRTERKVRSRKRILNKSRRAGENVNSLFAESERRDVLRNRKNTSLEIDVEDDSAIVEGSKLDVHVEEHELIDFLFSNNLVTECAIQTEAESIEEQIFRVQEAYKFQAGYDHEHPIAHMISKAGGFSNLITFLYQMFRSRNQGDYIAAIWQYVSYVNSESIKIKLVSELIAYIKKYWYLIHNESYGGRSPFYVNRPSIRTESYLTDTFESMSFFLDSILTSDFLIQIKNFILGVISFKYFDCELTRLFKREAGDVDSMSITDFIQHMLKSIGTLLRYGDSIADGLPLQDVILSSQPVDKLVTRGRDLMLWEDKLFTGLPVIGQKCARSYAIEMKEITDPLEILKKKVPSHGREYRKITRALAQLHTSQNSVRLKIEGKNRSTPVGVIIHGTPGIGKSRILLRVCSIWSAAKERIFHESHMYTRVLASEYWAEYEPFSHPIIHYSEAGNKSKPQVQRSGDDSIKELISLVDSIEHPVNMSESKQKGKVKAIPEMVILDCNDAGLNFNVLFNNPSAYERRFIYIEPTVKPEFRVEGGTAIDIQKSMDAGGDLMDRWLFKIVRKIPITNIRSVDQVLCSGIDINELGDVLTDLFRSHIEEQQNVKDQVDTQYYGPMENKSDLSDSFDHCDYSDEKYPSESESSSYDIVTESGLGQNIGDLRYRFFSNLRSLYLDIPNMLEQGFEWTKFHWYMYLLPMLLFIKPYALYVAVFTWEVLVPTFGIILGYILWILCFICTFFKPSWRSDLKLYAFQSVLQGMVNETRINIIRRYHDLAGINYVEHVVKTSRYDQLILTAEILAVFVGSYAAWTFSTRKKKVSSSGVSLEAQQSKFYNPHGLNRKLNDIEEKCDTDDEFLPVPNVLTPHWNSREVVLNHAVTRNRTEDIYRTVRRNVLKVRVLGDLPINTHLLGVQGNLALINKHSFGQNEKGPWTVSVPNNRRFDKCNVWSDTVVTKNDLVVVSDDIVMFQLKHQSFRNILNYFTTDIKQCEEYDAIVASVQKYHTKAIVPNNVLQIPDQVAHRGFLMNQVQVYKWHNHAQSLCGTPILSFIDKNLVITSMHTAANQINGDCYGSPVFKCDVERSILALTSSNRMMNIVSEGKLEKCCDLEDPNFKSPFRFEQLHGLRYFGRTRDNVNMNQKSVLTLTPIHEDLRDLYPVDFVDEEGNDIYGPPPLQPFVRDGDYISPWNIALRKMNKAGISLNSKTLCKVVDVIAERADSFEGKVAPIPLESAINGKDGSIAKRINASTGGGDGFVGKKSDHIPIVFPREHIREPTDQLKHSVVQIIETYMRGETVGSRYTAHLKDEARLMSKNRDGKTRVFYGAPIDILIVQRMYIYPLYLAMMQHTDIFCAAVGIDMYLGADKLVNDLLENSDIFMEGDYSSYDQTIPFDVRHAAATVVYDFAERFGYNEDALCVLRGILTEELFPIIKMNGDVFMTSIQTSGKLGTAENNSIIGMILVMYYWYRNTSDHFYDHVCLRTYGDDLIASVSPESVGFMNNLSYRDFCAGVYHMKFTPAVKTDSFSLNLTVDEITFLKRSFRFSTTLDRFVAPLDFTSIAKMGIYYMPSSHVGTSKHILDIGISSLWELFLHCDSEEEYSFYLDKWKEILISSFPDLALNDLDKLPDYERLLLHFQKDSSEDEFIDDLDGRDFE